MNDAEVPCRTSILPENWLMLRETTISPCDGRAEETSEDPEVVPLWLSAWFRCAKMVAHKARFGAEEARKPVLAIGNGEDRGGGKCECEVCALPRGLHNSPSSPYVRLSARRTPPCIRNPGKRWTRTACCYVARGRGPRCSCTTSDRWTLPVMVVQALRTSCFPRSDPQRR